MAVDKPLWLQNLAAEKEGYPKTPSWVTKLEAKRGQGLGDIEQEVAHWGRYNFPDATSDEQFLGVVEEVGEIAHAILKGKQGIRGYSPEDEEEIKDGIGDLIIFLLNYCDRRGWSLLEILQDTWEIVKQRDWIEFPENGLDK